jgi:hypothetical protein
MRLVELTLSVMLALISVPPFSKLPLHIRCFTEYAHAIMMASPAPPRDVSMILDLGGVSGSTGRRRDSTMGATSQSGPIDVSDNAFRSAHWNKWSTIRETNLCCGLCDDALDPLVRPYRSARPDSRIISTSCFVPPATAPMWLTCCASHHYARRRPSCCQRPDNVPNATLVSSGGKSSGAHMLGKKDLKLSRRSCKRRRIGLYGKAAAKRWIKATRAQVRRSAS